MSLRHGRCRLSVLAPALAAVVVIAACHPPRSAAVSRSPDAPAARIAYNLEPRPGTSEREAATLVRMTVAGHEGRPFTVRMPVWTPGEYRVQNHGRYIRAFQVLSPKVATVREISPGAWRVEPAEVTPVELSYQLPNRRPGIFTENVDVRSRSAFYDGAATFAYVDGRTAEAAIVQVKVPGGWSGVVSPLEPLPTGELLAKTYEELADSPLLVGDGVTRSFNVAGKDHILVFFGRHQGTDYAWFVDAFRRIVQAGREYMGELPYRRYVLFLDMNGRGGGLEHANSARIALPAYAPRHLTARFIAHEYFHLWNVKRIRPAAFSPLDLSKAPATRNLWFCEGVTEYVAGLLALRAGLLTEEAFLDNVAQLSRMPAPAVSAETASLRIWDDGRSTGYRGVSVYTSGEIAGFCLDLRLLDATDGRAGLRQVFTELWGRYGPAGYPEEGIREAVIRVGGEGMANLYDRLVRTTRPAPFDECLEVVGLARDPAAWGLRDTPSASERARRLRSIWLYGR